MIPPLERARSVANEVASRHAEAVDAEGRFPAESIEALKAAKLFGIFAPPELGGEGTPISDIGSICHLLGRACGSTALIYAMHQIQAACIVLHGQQAEWQRETLKRITAEQWLLASATTEGATGGDLSRSDCAIRTESDRFTIEKRGAVISYGGHADAILVTARRAPDAPESDQILAVIPRHQFELTTTARWDALGMRGTRSNTYLFQGEGHVDQILPCPYGDIQSDTMVPFSHLTWSCVWHGIATDAVSRARRYLRGKAATTAGHSPAQSRLVQATSKLQQMKADIVTGLKLYEALLASADRTAPMSLLVAMNNLKLSVSTGVVEVVQQALTICGISGYRNDSEFSVGRHLRDAHSAALMVANDRITAGMGRMLLVQRADPDLLA